MKETKKTGKILCALLAAAMLFSLCACGSSASSVSGTQTVTSGSSVSGTVTTPAPDPTEKPADEPVEETPQEEEAEEPQEEEEHFSVGATVNNAYENTYFGIGVTLDDNWVFNTQEEIDEVNGLVQDVVDNDSYAEALENGTVYTDMIANANEGLVSMNATIEKLNAISTLAIDEEGYIDLSLEGNDFKAIFAEIGLDVTVVEKGTVTIAGAEHPCVVIEGSIQGIGFYEKIAAIKKGNYVLDITVSSLAEDVVDDVFAYFYAL